MDAWAEKYKGEALKLIRQNCEQYNDMVRMSNVAAAKLCEHGNHSADSRIAFCKKCGKSFCLMHGDFKKFLCDKCCD